ncbi:MAG: type II toxin-antitoxin system prevent-host-death family antitoxin [Gemmatimonadetes bacterium]|nr:type II toxin-antitoxin system prevent-host-death family antitoxin [Gemmatimonadota bacterium]
MRAAGIREVKNKLSEFLRLVRHGEVVLVTDRGRVVAQLAPPPVFVTSSVSEEAALAELAAAGKVRPATRSLESATAPPLPKPRGRIDLAAALDETRSDRLAAGRGR